MPSSSSSAGGAVEPINNITAGWKYLGFMRYGDNSAGGIWELCVGKDLGSNCSTGNRVWDSDWVDVTMTVALSDDQSQSAASLAVGSTIQYSGSPFSKITGVQIQVAATNVQGEMEMRFVSAVFVHADGGTETIVVPSNLEPVANNSSGSSSVSQAIGINPPSNDLVAVSVHAQVRLSHTTTSPSENSLSAGIYVFAA